MQDKDTPPEVPVEKAAPVEEKSPRKRYGGSKKEVSFARPVFAEEIMTTDGKKRFNELPAWQRHLIKRTIDHGDLARAAREAGVSTYVNKHVDNKLAETKSITECLNAGGVTSEDIAHHLKECLEADCTRFDKHQNVVHFVDLDLKLKTIELICKLRGDFLPKPESKDARAGVVELFNDTDIETGSGGKETRSDREAKGDSEES